ncbi:hypothetical protein [endosymbiont 'TC1' of Trimyema compressum]|nr:hypothetical protein [endosymbiont 'TC1' of Trimyema compressum]
MLYLVFTLPQQKQLEIIIETDNEPLIINEARRSITIQNTRREKE